MRIIGLLSWYEEPASWLAECVASAAKLCDHLIAVDGPYGMFPGAASKPASGIEQADVIAHTAAGAGIGCTIHTPRRPWLGGEVEKRDYMFRFGMTMAEPGVDWFLRIDADEVVTQAPADVVTQLADTDFDAADVTFWDRGDVDHQYSVRALFRALPGIGVQQAHHVVTVPSPTGVRVLMGDEDLHDVEPALNAWEIRVEHRTHQRNDLRKALKTQYYAQRPLIEKTTAF